MRKMKLAATGLVISAFVVLGFWWLEPEAGKTAERIVDATSAQQAMPSRPVPRQPNADAEPKVTNEAGAVATSLDDVYSACGGMLQGGLPPDQHRRRVEAVRLKYVIAAETIAAASGVSLRGRYANPAGPGHLDGHDTHLARVAAQAMIAEHRARFGGPLP